MKPIRGATAAPVPPSPLRGASRGPPFLKGSAGPLQLTGEGGRAGAGRWLQGRRGTGGGRCAFPPFRPWAGAGGAPINDLGRGWSRSHLASPDARADPQPVPAPERGARSEQGVDQRRGQARIRGVRSARQGAHRDGPAVAQTGGAALRLRGGGEQRTGVVLEGVGGPFRAGPVVGGGDRGGQHHRGGAG